MFRLSGNRYGIEPIKYRCPICGRTRVVHLITVTKAPIGTGYVVHYIFKCIYCDSVQEHGIRVPDSFIEKLRERIGRDLYHVLSAEETYELLDEDEKKVFIAKLERLNGVKCGRGTQEAT